MVDRVDETTGKRKQGWGEAGPGRPSLKTPEVCAEICDRLAQGYTLEDICSTDEPNIPASRTVRAWMMEDAQFSAEVSRARAIGFDAIAERARRTARGFDESRGGESTGDVARDKLIFEVDKHLLGIWDHRKFGTRHTVQGDKEADPIQHAHTVDLSKLSVDDLRALRDLAEKTGAVTE